MSRWPDASDGRVPTEDSAAARVAAQLRWLKLAGPGGHWLGLDVPSTGTVCGAIARRNGDACDGELLYTREDRSYRYAIKNRINVTTFWFTQGQACTSPPEP